jgi:hypothetical protein
VISLFFLGNLRTPPEKCGARGGCKNKKPEEALPNARDASSTAAAGRRYKRVIDAHMHWYPQAFVDLMIRKGPAHGAS